MNVACKGKFILGPDAWGLGEGLKGQISFNFSYKVNFKDLFQTVCVFLKINLAWVMAQGCDLWALGCPGGQKLFKHGHAAYQIDRDDEQNRMQVKFIC